MSAFVIAPICPHTMTYRPLVVPASVRIEVSLRSADEEVYLTLDGQVGFPFETDDRLLIDRHPHRIRIKTDQPREVAAKLVQRNRVRAGTAHGS